MNKLMIIGNLTREPELRTTQEGKKVCTFSVAVNRRKKIEGKADADFFRVSAWKDLGENCAKFLTTGKKVCVVGEVSVHTYQKQNGEAGASLEVNASEVEFLSQKNSAEGESPY